MATQRFGPVLIKHPNGKTSTYCRAHIEKGGGQYTTSHGAIPFKSAVPCKQDFTGWLSPDGFLFACPYAAVAPTTYPHNYEEAAKEILRAVGCEDAGYNKNTPKLQSKGWVFLVNNELHLSQAWTLNDLQVDVQAALKGVEP